MPDVFRLEIEISPLREYWETHKNVIAAYEGQKLKARFAEELGPIIQKPPIPIPFPATVSINAYDHNSRTWEKVAEFEVGEKPRTKA